jgi:hypothetical protein
MKGAAFSLSWLALASSVFAFVPGCKEPQTQLRVTFPGDPDAGACEAQTSLRCVNYLQFTAGNGSEFFSHCLKVDVTLGDLCDVAKLAEGQELFKLPPDTPLPITLQGLRVYPATSCNSATCAPRLIFSGSTAGTGRIGDHAGAVLDLPVTIDQPCGLPEEFFFLPPGSTCAEVCRGEVVCDGVQGGCLCKSLEQGRTAAGLD